MDIVRIIQTSWKYLDVGTIKKHNGTCNGTLHKNPNNIIKHFRVNVEKATKGELKVSQ